MDFWKSTVCVSIVRVWYERGKRDNNKRGPNDVTVNVKSSLFGDAPILKSIMRKTNSLSASSSVNGEKVVEHGTSDMNVLHSTSE